MSYNFDHVSDHEFELLCADLLAEMYGQHFEVFSPGRDGGVDIRLIKQVQDDSLGPQLVGQCKKWRADTYKALLRELEKVERPKLATLDVEQYLLFTTVPMNPDRKAEVRQALAPYLHSPADIFGPEDLQLLVGRNVAVARRHPKLWLTGTEVLDAIVNAATRFRSESVAERLKDQLILWVPNDSFDDAKSLLTATRTCVISGPPGIGKTMLADVLSLATLAKDMSP